MTAYTALISKEVLILGAGFGGLELASRLSASVAGSVNVTLIDRAEGFVFGFSKFELMLGRATLPEVSFFYRDLVKPGVEFRQETVLSIDPAARRVTSDAQSYDPDYLVVALGAECDPAATPGLVEGGHEFYTVPGAIAPGNCLNTPLSQRSLSQKPEVPQSRNETRPEHKWSRRNSAAIRRVSADIVGAYGNTPALTGDSWTFETASSGRGLG